MPAEEGFRWPAEWEPHAATWLSWPHNTATWPSGLEAVEETFADLVRVLSRVERVCINVCDGRMADRAGACLRASGVGADADVSFFEIPTDDAWVRDHGPIFVTRQREGRRETALIDFDFDAWGGKYPPWDRDDAVPRQIADVRGLRRFEAGFVLEGGSVEGNGDGVVVTTESCLLNPNRGSSRSRGSMEQRLAETLGAQQVVWLESGIEGDDTDGHVDDVTRFVSTHTLVTVVEKDASDVNEKRLRENLRRLREARRPDGGNFDVVPLPMPEAVRSASGVRYPASYANFFLANGLALVPTFGVRTDERALSILGELLSGREVIGVPSRDLVAGLGSVHCLTQQEPDNVRA